MLRGDLIIRTISFSSLMKGHDGLRRDRVHGLSYERIAIRVSPLRWGVSHEQKGVDRVPQMTHSFPSLYVSQFSVSACSHCSESVFSLHLWCNFLPSKLRF